MKSNFEIVRLISSWGFIGFAPVAPGTFGSLAGIPLCFTLSKLNVYISSNILILLSIIAIWSSNFIEKKSKKKDPSEIVIDEVVGMTFAGFALPFTTNYIFTSFVLFRLIDILKPQPIRIIEKIPGGYGIVCDDIVAGIASNLIVRSLFAIHQFTV